MVFFPLLGAAVILCFVSLVAICIRRYRRSGRATDKTQRTIPGLQPRNESGGNLGDLAEAGSLHQFLVQLHETFGPIASFWWGPKMVVSVHKPQNMKEYSAIFDRPAELFQLFEPLIGASSIQYANGEDGRRRHTAYGRCFTEAKLKSYYALWNEIAWDSMQKLADVPPGDHVAIREHGFAFAIKSMLLAAFGRYFDDDDRVQDLRMSYDMVWHYMERALAGDIAEAGSKRHQEFLTNKKRICDSILKLVNSRASNPPSDDSDLLFVDVLISMHGQDEETLLSDAISMLIGGFHTTGLLLTWSLYYLAKHPEVQQRVLEELDAVMGDEDEIAIEKFDDLTFTRQVLNETLRCSQLAPFAARVADSDMKLTDGPVAYTVPAETPVVLALGVALQDAEFWTNPEDFDPERFESEKYKATPYGFEPFGFAGKRKCPGYRFAQHEAIVLLSHAIRRFQFHLVPGQSVKKVYGLVTKTEEEIWLTVEARTS